MTLWMLGGSICLPPSSDRRGMGVATTVPALSPQLDPIFLLGREGREAGIAVRVSFFEVPRSVWRGLGRDLQSVSE
jgi:hypothetical protein